jgi:hypothetical protein
VRTAIAKVSGCGPGIAWQSWSGLLPPPLIRGPSGAAADVAHLLSVYMWFPVPSAGNGYLTICNELTGVCGTAYYEGVCLLTTSSVNVCACESPH